MFFIITCWHRCDVVGRTLDSSLYFHIIFYSTWFLETVFSRLTLTFKLVDTTLLTNKLSYKYTRVCLCVCTYIKDPNTLHDLLIHIFLRLRPVDLDGVTPQLESSCGTEQHHVTVTRGCWRFKPVNEWTTRAQLALRWQDTHIRVAVQKRKFSRCSQRVRLLFLLIKLPVSHHCDSHFKSHFH